LSYNRSINTYKEKTISESIKTKEDEYIY